MPIAQLPVDEMIAETASLCIRQYTTKDVPALLPILTDPQTMAFWPRPFTAEEVEQWVSTTIQRYVQDGFGRYAVLLKHNGAQIGDAGIVRTTIDNQPAFDLGYIIAAPYWRHGYATEAAAALKEYAFATLGLESLYANMATDHVGSQRVAEKLGMQRIKEFNNSRNRNLPTYVYSIHRSGNGS